MKKMLCIVLSLVMVFTLASCGNVENIDNSTNSNTEINTDVHSSDYSSQSQTTSDEVSTDLNSDQSNNINTDSITNSDTVKNTNSSTNSTATNGTTDSSTNRTDTNDTTDSSTNDDSVSLDNADNGVLKEVSPETMKVPENMKFLGSEDVSEENNSTSINATVVFYSLDGDVVNWTTEKDLIYVITSGNNRLVVINSKNMSPVYNVPLSGTPAEMNIVGDKIYISFPDLCKIEVFSKSNGKKETTLAFDHEVSSFCLDGNYIYYSEHDQFCKVYKKNLVTDEIKTVETDGNNLFYYPKLYLNKEDGILYIGESGSSGCALYYFDAETLKLKSVFKKDNYGITNHTREIFHVGDEIFWGSYRLSDTNARELVGKYGSVPYGSVTYASEDLVSTFNGLFLAETYECIIDYFDAGFNFEYILVSDSYHIFFRKRSIDKNIIIGINFNLQ